MNESINQLSVSRMAHPPLKTAVFVATLKNITYILSLGSGCDEDCTILKTHPQNWEL